MKTKTEKHLTRNYYNIRDNKGRFTPMYSYTDFGYGFRCYYNVRDKKGRFVKVMKKS